MPRESRFKTKIDDVWVTDLTVLRSNAGWYIGRMCWNEDADFDFGGFEEPYTRESEYFPTREAAEAAHRSLSFEGREYAIENRAAYEEGVLPRPKSN